MWWLAAAGVSALASAASSSAQGQEVQRNAYRQAALDEFEARGLEEEGKRAALKIYTQSAAVKSQQLAQLAYSGVVVGDGSAQAVIDETDKLTRQDAMATLYSADRQAASKRAGASARMRGGDDALLTGNIKAVGSLISSGISMYGQYSSYKGNTKGNTK